MAFYRAGYDHIQGSPPVLGQQGMQDVGQPMGLVIDDVGDSHGLLREISVGRRYDLEWLLGFWKKVYPLPGISEPDLKLLKDEVESQDVSREMALGKANLSKKSTVNETSAHL